MERDVCRTNTSLSAAHMMRTRLIGIYATKLYHPTPFSITHCHFRCNQLNHSDHYHTHSLYLFLPHTKYNISVQPCADPVRRSHMRKKKTVAISSTLSLSLERFRIADVPYLSF